MSEISKRQLHLYCTDEQWKEISDGLDKAGETETGKIRAGDLLRNILLNFVRNQNKTIK